jgi:hypothetical protein
MAEILHSIIVVILYVLYILLIPVVMLIATPFVCLWPGQKTIDGKRQKRDIRSRYKRVWKVWESLGVGLPTS